LLLKVPFWVKLPPMVRSVGATTVAPELMMKSAVVEALSAKVLVEAPMKVVLPKAEPPVIVPERVWATGAVLEPK